MRGDKPLAGTRVLDLTRLLPGGFATLMLADLGADVVKIEQPGQGDYVRWMPPLLDADISASHAALNRAKRSIVIDLKQPDGAALLRRLAGDSDVLIESFRPGVMTRLGLGQEALRAENPRLIFCAISGYGQTGPLAQTAGHDINYIGRAGILSLIGNAERPMIPGVQIGDLAGGAMAAVIAVLAALVRRAVTGEGDFCDIAMMDGAASWLSMHAAEHIATGALPEREAMTLSGGYPCYRVYPAADGWITVGALEPHFWVALCDAIDRPDLVGDGFASGERRAEVIAQLEDLFRTKTRAEWEEHLAGRDVCVGPVNDLSEALQDPQLLARGMVVDAEIAGRPWRYLGDPVKLDATAASLDVAPPPHLGEHTDEVLSEYGLDQDEVARLRTAGALG